MKMIALDKATGIFLLIIFTLQMTDIACIGEDLSLNTLGIQGENQLIKADLKEHSPVSVLDGCQCPCHLSFLQFPSTEVISYQAIGLPLTFAGNPCLKKVSANIFQPPKVLI
ncbi:MAG: hypothetical protein HY266_09680 [Deltaproteobacteria bacterium]|nr:hypothetical protein [Deltaproteobacteria bacterium]